MKNINITGEKITKEEFIISLQFNTDFMRSRSWDEELQNEIQEFGKQLNELFKSQPELEDVYYDFLKAQVNHF